jgi:outer membrane protein assembly factor BamB
MCTEEVTGYEDVPVDVDEAAADGATAAPTPRTTPSPIIKLWCGTGWTGQPAVHELDDGTTEVVFGGFDGNVHFVDGATGAPTRPPFPTGDMIKGSVTLDPDGLPLLYTGSRDGYLRVIALDRAQPTELWRLGSSPNGVWNNDWDGNPVVVGDLLLEGGEDSWFYAVQLNKGLGADGLVTVDPEVLVEVPGFDDELFAATGDRNVSIESSVAVFEDRVYLANSGGRVLGLDLSAVAGGTAPIVFDYWVGDDVDATVVVDEEGMLYVAVELERFLPRADEVGQLVKLDPTATGDPRVWGVDVPPQLAGDDGGIWGTPALHEDVLYVTTHPGDLLVVDRSTGEVLWQQDIGYHEWSSPVVVDGTLIVAGCEAGALLAWSVADPANPVELWTSRTPTGACIESTPAVWGGRIYVGTRDGYFYGFG